MQLPISVKGMLAVWGIAAVVLVVMPNPSPPMLHEPKPDFLAEDAYLQIGGERLVLPFVMVMHHPKTYWLGSGALGALPSWRFRRRFSADYGNPHAPYGTGKVAMRLNQLTAMTHLGQVPQNCALLNRQWARDICTDTWSGRLKDLPSSFVLYDDTEFGNVLTGTQRIGRARIPGKPEVDCAKVSKFCTAALPITPRLYAVWDIWLRNSPSETANERAQRQGRAIYQLVKYGFGKKENFEQVIAVK